jgi:hypothetical protein
MNHNKIYISYIFKYIILSLILFLSLRYILPYKVDNKHMIIILLINIIPIILLDKYNTNLKEIKYISENNIDYRLLD